MINKLPRWVEVGAFSLALNAGFINAVGLLGFEHQAVSHLTGTTAFFSLALAHGEAAHAVHLLIILLSFVAGAAFSGVVVGNTALQLGRRYSIALLAESALLAGAMLLLTGGSTAGHFLASAACGLQNAMTSTYSGAIVRTTHVSGLFTDLGVALGLRLRGRAIHARKLAIYLILMAGFIGGGVLGALAFARLHFLALSVPCLIAAGMAFFYWGYLYRKQARWRHLRRRRLLTLPPDAKRPD